MNYRLVGSSNLFARRFTAVVTAAIAAIFAYPTTAPAQAAAAGSRVEFARLLPSDAFFYVHIRSAARFRDDWWQTSVGRMINDPQFRPLIDQSFAALEKAAEPVREATGLTLAELIELPKGELGLGLVPIEGRSPEPLVLIEAADDDPSVSTLLTRGREA